MFGCMLLQLVVYVCIRFLSCTDSYLPKKESLWMSACGVDLPRYVKERQNLSVCVGVGVKAFRVGGLSFILVIIHVQTDFNYTFERE